MLQFWLQFRNKSLQAILGLLRLPNAVFLPSRIQSVQMQSRSQPNKMEKTIKIRRVVCLVFFHMMNAVKFHMECVCVNNLNNLEEKNLAALQGQAVLFLVLWTRLCSILWKQLKPRSCFVFYSKCTYIHDKACGLGPTNELDWWWMPLCNPGV